MISQIHKLGQKRIAVCLLFFLFTEIFCPSVALALTSGPTTPETTSFEPVDTTDMVNMQTGDFTYNVPILEVPGPEGGYPLALSYHAGILPGEDASWVGLGWTLNPGAITRSVNGYPDDWTTPQQTVRDYWVGGKQETYSVGVSVGIAGAASVGVGLDFSNDTYRGFGLGTSVSAGVGINNTPVSIGFTVGTSAYGDGYGGLNLGIAAGPGVGQSGLTAGISVGLNFSEAGSSMGFSGGVGYSKGNVGQQNNASFSLVGASLQTAGNKSSLSVGGLTSSAHNQNAGKLSTSGAGFSIPIPIWYGINLQLGYNKTRYWSDETTTKFTHGSLNVLGWPVSNERAYDTYSLLDDYQGQNFVDEPDPRRTLGGSYLDFDVYSVNAQGLAGNMRPYFFQGELRSQNLKDNSTGNLKSVVTYLSSANVGNRAQFRFVNDFSNSYRQEYPNTGFDTTPDVGHPNAPAQFDGYSVDNKLQGSKNIETYTLDAVPLKPRNAKGYSTNWIKNLAIDGKAASSSRSSLIGGFSVTNQSGVTYHFSLPAYSYREQSYQQVVDRSKGMSFNRQTKPEPYAYTWHLTAITGADYIDKNNNKIVDDGDWGYWVSFEYGKYTSSYVWRTPDTGFNRDEDADFEDMSIGTKEVYYLNAVRTRSHIALFEKEARFDAKGVDPSSYTQNSSNHTSNAGYFSSLSVHSMKLNKIYLVNAADSLYGNTNFGTQRSFRTAPCPNCELPANVFDSDDVNALGRATIESKAIKVIDFNHDYSLANGTTNSFDINNPSLKFGKLTLKSYDIRGKKGAKVLPPTKFDYDLTDRKITTDIIPQLGGEFKTSTPSLKPGDMLKTSDGVYFGVVTEGPFLQSTAPNPFIYRYVAGNQSFEAGISVNVATTKNPDYNKSNRDYWGHYKADYRPSGILHDDHNFGTETTQLSGLNVDAWSLRKITTALGNQINIGYESDDFSEVVMEDNAYPIIESITKLDDYRIRFKLKSNIPNIHRYFSVGEICNALLVGDDVYHYPSGSWVFDNSYDKVNKIIFDNVLTITARNDSYMEATSNVILKAYDLGDGSRPKHNSFQLLTGNLQKSSSGLMRYGGGIRVKSISVEDKSGYHMSTQYTYGTENDPNLSSGYTTYLPGVLPQFQLKQFSVDAHLMSRISVQNVIKKYKKLLYRDHISIYALAREVPPPSVLYKNVTAYTSVLDNNGDVIHNTGTTVYEFDSFKRNMVGRVILENRAVSGGPIYRNQVLKKFLAGIGNLKSTKKYNGNGKLVSKVTNHYLHDGLENSSLVNFMNEYEARLADFNFQGIVKERVFESKQVYDKNTNYNNYTTYRIYNGKEDLPCVPIGITTVDYITGVTSSISNIAFDFYSGSLIKKVTEDGYGNRFLTESTPAYNMYPDMGIYWSSKKNMLSQIAETKVYKVDNNNVKKALVAASVQTWGTNIPVLDPAGSTVQQNIWRMTDSYVWAPSEVGTDGLTAMGQFQAFNYHDLSTLVSSWQKISDVSLYNVFSKPLEVRDINGSHVATRFGEKNSKVFVTGGPANHSEIAFSGAEDETILGSNATDVMRGAAVLSDAQAHTGTKSLLLAKSQRGFIYTVPVNKIKSTRDYAASVWVRAQSGTATDAKLHYEIDNTIKGSSTSSAATTKKAGDWTLLTLNIKKEDLIPGSTLKVFVQNDHASSTYADDFRFQPVDAATTAYVYDKFSGELTHVLDNNNLFTKYEYDDAGRLVRTYVEKLGRAPFKVAENHYNYSQPFSTGNSTVYARLEFDNIRDANYSQPTGERSSSTSAAVSIRFYWDIFCTQPANLPSAVDLLYRENSEWFGGYNTSGSNSVDYNVRASQGANSILIHNLFYLHQSNTYLEERFGQYYITEESNVSFELLHRNNSGSLLYFSLANKFNY